MNTVIKYIISVLVGIILLGVGGVAIWQWRESVKYQDLLNVKAEELQQANLEIGKAHTQILDQKVLHEKAMAAMSDQVQAEIKKYKALVTMYAQLETAYNMEHSKVGSLTSTIEELLKATSIADLPIGRLFYKKDNGTLADIRSIKWTYQDFRVDLAGEAVADGLNEDQTIKIKHDLEYKIHLKFRAKVVRTAMPNKVSNYYGELFEVGPDGKDLGKLTLTNFEVIESKDLPSKMMWWNPKLDIGLGVGVTHKGSFDWSANIGVSAMSYGKSSYDITWRFINLGVSLHNSSSPGIDFTPVQYNIVRGLGLKILSNIWIGPTAGISLDKNWTFQLSVRAVL